MVSGEGSALIAGQGVALTLGPITGKNMKYLFIHTILFLTLISVPGQVTGQTDFPVEIIESDQYLEQIIMITDRKVYASGEPVYFRVYNNSPNPGELPARY